MQLDIKKLKKITRFMRKEGVLVLKTPEIELQISPSKLFHVERKQKLNQSAATETVETQQPTEEELLFYSSTPPDASEI